MVPFKLLSPVHQKFLADEKRREQTSQNYVAQYFHGESSSSNNMGTFKRAETVMIHLVGDVVPYYASRGAHVPD